MNVAELIDLLKDTDVDPDTPVILEGCDCEGDCDGVTLSKTYDGLLRVLLTRPDGIWADERKPDDDQ